ncbi:MAG TPA: VOC family protein [Alphaproteobacteria bacterium]|nr:VOC family protein [Alphaproteobacteria bacterium]
MSAIEGLGHVGIYTEDLLRMRDFYTRVLGLQLTDEDLERGIVFLSANPEAEHHEVALVRGRDAPRGVKLVNQISFKVKSLDDLKDLHRRLQAEQLPIERFVSHGISLGLYAYDPEGNRLELYYKTDFKAPQPLGEPVDIEASNDELLAVARAAEARAKG